MSGSLNKVMLIGNLGRDPEVRSFPSGGQVCNLNVATTETWRDRDSGERRERTEWHRVAVFGEGLVRNCEQYLRKGSKIYIEGQLQTRKWQDQATGSDRYSTEVVVRGFGGTVTFLDRRSDDGFGPRDGGHEGSGGHFGGQDDSRRTAPIGYDSEEEDELPF